MTRPPDPPRPLHPLTRTLRVAASLPGAMLALGGSLMLAFLGIASLGGRTVPWALEQSLRPLLLVTTGLALAVPPWLGWRRLLGLRPRLRAPEATTAQRSLMVPGIAVLALGVGGALGLAVAAMTGWFLPWPWPLYAALQSLMVGAGILLTWAGRGVRSDPWPPARPPAGWLPA